MKKSNKEVIRAFVAGRDASNHRGTLRSEGLSLWSYDLKIAHRHGDGIVVGDFTAPGGDFHSMTTSMHVGMVKREANTIMLPAVFIAVFDWKKLKRLSHG